MNLKNGEIKKVIIKKSHQKKVISILMILFIVLQLGMSIYADARSDDLTKLSGPDWTGDVIPTANTYWDVIANAIAYNWIDKTTWWGSRINSQAQTIIDNGINALPEGEKVHGGGVGKSFAPNVLEPIENNLISDVENEFNSDVIDSNLRTRTYVGSYNSPIEGNGLSASVKNNITTYSITTRWTASPLVEIQCDSFIAPCSGTYQLVLKGNPVSGIASIDSIGVGATGTYTINMGYGKPVASGYTKSSSSFSLIAGQTMNTTVKLTGVNSSGTYYKALSFSVYYGLVSPTLPGEIYNGDQLSGTRIGEVNNIGNYYTYNGENITTYDNRLFNETNNNMYNPVTSTTTSMPNWTYDYSTRTYTSGSNNITYGDYYITQNDGGNTYYYYYGDVYYDSPSGLSTDPEIGQPRTTETTETTTSEVTTAEVTTAEVTTVPNDSDGEWWGEFFGNLVKGLADGIKAFFLAIAEVVNGLVTGLLSFITQIVDLASQLPTMVTDVMESIGGMYSWLPTEIVATITALFALILLVAFIKMFI